MPTDYAGQFDALCPHDPKCPSWWGCGTHKRGSYEAAKNAYSDYMVARVERACGYKIHDIGTAHEQYIEAMGYDPRQGNLKSKGAK